MITLTENAINRISSDLQKRGKGLGIRLGVKTTGCSGYAYVLEFVDAEQSGDVILGFEGIRVYVDQAHLPMVEDVTVDYKVKDKFTSGFDISNPKEKDRCGCGESFRV